MPRSSRAELLTSATRSLDPQQRIESATSRSGGWLPNWPRGRRQAAQPVAADTDFQTRRAQDGAGRTGPRQPRNHRLGSPRIRHVKQKPCSHAAVTVNEVPERRPGCTTFERCVRGDALEPRSSHSRVGRRGLQGPCGSGPGRRRRCRGPTLRRHPVTRTALGPATKVTHREKADIGCPFRGSPLLLLSFVSSEKRHDSLCSDYAGTIDCGVSLA